MSAPPTHFLSLARHNLATGPRELFDVSTVAAADYDVDVRTGFMPPAEPVRRLVGEFEAWEVVLDRALGVIKLAKDPTATEEDKAWARGWRQDVRDVRMFTCRATRRPYLPHGTSDAMSVRKNTLYG